MRVAMISMHTSPLVQPGSGDAGGMNVYIKNTAQELARMGIEVDIFTRATRGSDPEIIEVEPGLRVINMVAGPYEGLNKDELASQLAAFTGSIVSFQKEAEVEYDVIHAHYWLSGQVAWLLHDLWNIPFVYTAHTWAAVKNSHLALGDTPEPESRRIAEQQIVDNADVLIVNTDAEISQLVDFYDADAQTVEIVSPGVDTALFTPGTNKATEQARRELGIPLNAKVVGFAGRLQKLKGPDVLIEAMADLLKQHPRESIFLVMVGGASGSDPSTPDELKELAKKRGIEHRVRFLAPRPMEDLVRIYQAVDIVAVPSANESFGLVALEAQASGTPVVASRVGGLQFAIDDGVTGLLVDDQEPTSWAEALYTEISEGKQRKEHARNAVAHAQNFSWKNSAQQLKEIYTGAIDSHKEGHDADMRNAQGVLPQH